MNLIFAYTALDSKGNPFHGTLKERSWTQAIRRVKEMGLFPTLVEEQKRSSLVERLKPVLTGARAATSSRSAAQSMAGGKVSLKVLTAFTRQLATLIDAGIPIVRGLRSIEQQEENRHLRRVLNKVTLDIESGSTLSEAFRRHPKIFSPFYLNMIVAGETAGMLESTLTRLADFMERNQKIRSKIISSSIYPAAVIAAAAGIMTILTVWVIPRFRSVFLDLTGNASLPPFTEFILGTSDFVRSHLLGFIVSAISLGTVLRAMYSTRRGHMALDALLLKIPVIGKIARKAAICQIARTLGTTLENGVPVLRAVLIARESSTNAVFSEALLHTHDRVKEGDPLTTPLQQSGVFPSTVISMIDAGEQSGALPGILTKIADIYEVEVDNAISAGLSLLEPMLIIFLGIVVGSIVIGLFLPIIGAAVGINPSGGAE